MSLQQQLSVEEAKAIMHGGLGIYELQLVTSFCTPLYWVIRNSDLTFLTRNGTAFFLDAGRGPFGVTACHVIDGWRKSEAENDAGPLRLAGQGSSIVLDWDARVIDANTEIDIATFSVTDAEVKTLGKTVLTGYQKTWPPGPPEVNCGIYYCGYPGVGTRYLSATEVVFGAVPGSGIASSVSDKDISTLIEREHLTAALGGGIPPENFDFGGISGGPMITVVQSSLRSWALAGVMYQGPNTEADPARAIAGLEIIKARRAHFILPDGCLDVATWGTLHV
ncbi:MAG: hypothetical protein ABSC25_21990 [Roseiarcus sp.]